VRQELRHGRHQAHDSHHARRVAHCTRMSSPPIPRKRRATGRGAAWRPRPYGIRSTVYVQVITVRRRPDSCDRHRIPTLRQSPRPSSSYYCAMQNPGIHNFSIRTGLPEGGPVLASSPRLSIAPGPMPWDHHEKPSAGPASLAPAAEEPDY
jgi:hypothetical protein